MNNDQIEFILDDLTIEEKSYLFERLKTIVLGDISRNIKSCPCCGSTKFVKRGSYKGVQKYICKTTSKIFSYKSKTVISGITKMDKLIELLELMSEGKLPTVFEIERKLKVSHQTAFDWRTKVLTSLYREVNFDSSIIEFDETNFMISTKGRKGVTDIRKRGDKLVGDNSFNVKVFMTYSRTTKKLELFQSHIGKTKFTDVDNYLSSKKDLLVYSDMHKSYAKYYKQKSVLNARFRSSDHVSLVDPEVHNQTLNYYTGMIKDFINRDLHGVSTKYLQGYLNWIMFVENVLKERDVKIKDVITDNKVALDIYKQKDKEFQYFLKNNGHQSIGTYKEKYILNHKAVA